jgi:hypothetical protein
VSGAVPLATTLKATVCPEVTVWCDGCAVIRGMTVCVDEPELPPRELSATSNRVAVGDDFQSVTIIGQPEKALPTGSQGRESF